MEWIEINHSEYQSIFEESWTIFHSAKFNELNKNKAEKIHYFHLKSKGADYGIIFGERDGNYFSPFSSPFGGIESKGVVNPEEISIVAQQLLKIFRNLPGSSFITFPPLFYNENQIHHIIEGLKTGGFRIMYTDINFHLELDPNIDPEVIMERNAKKNLAKGLRSEHSFLKAETQLEKQRAYAVIKQNRDEKGFPLKLSFEDLEATAQLVPIDYYLLQCESKDAAAAIVFKINSNVAMVVYWGHLSEFSDFRPTNLLAYYLYKTYSSKSFSQLDIGPSSEFGILNEGLAAFKDSIGCIRTEKITLTLEHG